MADPVAERTGTCVAVAGRVGCRVAGRVISRVAEEGGKAEDKEKGEEALEEEEGPSFARKKLPAVGHHSSRPAA